VIQFVDTAQISLVEAHGLRAHILILQVAYQQSHRSGDAGIIGDDDARRPDQFGQFNGVERTRTARCEQGVLSRINPFAHGTRPNRECHIVVDHLDDARRRLGDR